MLDIRIDRGSTGSADRQAFPLQQEMASSDNDSSTWPPQITVPVSAAQSPNGEDTLLTVHIPDDTCPPAGKDDRQLLRRVFQSEIKQVDYQGAVSGVPTAEHLLTLRLPSGDGNRHGEDQVTLHLDGHFRVVLAEVGTSENAPWFNFMPLQGSALAPLVPSNDPPMSEQKLLERHQRVDGLHLEPPRQDGTATAAINHALQGSVVQPDDPQATDFEGAKGQLDKIGGVTLAYHSASSLFGGDLDQRLQIFAQRVDECGFALYGCRGGEFGTLVKVAAQDGHEAYAVLLGPHGQAGAYLSAHDALWAQALANGNGDQGKAWLNLICAPAGQTLPALQDKPLGAYVLHDGFKFARNLSEEDIERQQPATQKALREAAAAAPRGMLIGQQVRKLVTGLGLPTTHQAWRDGLDIAPANEIAALGLQAWMLDYIHALVSHLHNQGLPLQDLRLHDPAPYAPSDDALRALVCSLAQRNELVTSCSQDHWRTASRSELVQALEHTAGAGNAPGLRLLPQELLLLPDGLTGAYVERAAQHIANTTAGNDKAATDALRSFLTAIRVGHRSAAFPGLAIRTTYAAGSDGLTWNRKLSPSSPFLCQLVQAYLDRGPDKVPSHRSSHDKAAITFAVNLELFDSYFDPCAVQPSDLEPKDAQWWRDKHKEAAGKACTEWMVGGLVNWYTEKEQGSMRWQGAVVNHLERPIPHLALKPAKLSNLPRWIELDKLEPIDRLEAFRFEKLLLDDLNGRLELDDAEARHEMASRRFKAYVDVLYWVKRNGLTSEVIDMASDDDLHLCCDAMGIQGHADADAQAMRSALADPKLRPKDAALTVCRLPDLVQQALVQHLIDEKLVPEHKKLRGVLNAALGLQFKGQTLTHLWQPRLHMNRVLLQTWRDNSSVKKPILDADTHTMQILELKWIAKWRPGGPNPNPVMTALIEQGAQSLPSQMSGSPQQQVTLDLLGEWVDALPEPDREAARAVLEPWLAELEQFTNSPLSTVHDIKTSISQPEDASQFLRTFGLESRPERDQSVFLAVYEKVVAQMLPARESWRV